MISMILMMILMIMIMMILLVVLIKMIMIMTIMMITLMIIMMVINNNIDENGDNGIDDDHSMLIFQVIFFGESLMKNLTFSYLLIYICMGPDLPCLLLFLFR